MSKFTLINSRDDAYPYWYKAKILNISQVYDGDTITKAEIDLGFNISIVETLRLVGINTPELRGDERERGLISRDFLREKIKVNEYFLIRTRKGGKGKYGRWLAEIFVDGVNLNKALLDEGLALSYWLD